MNVGVRITIAASLMTLIACFALSWYAVRERSQSRWDVVQQQAKEIAHFARRHVQALGLRKSLQKADAISSSLTTSHWQISLVPADTNDPTESQQTQLRILQETQRSEVTTRGSDFFSYSVPLRVPSADPTKTVDLLGIIQVWRGTSYLARARKADVVEISIIAGIALFVATLAIYLFAARLITRPVRKLVAGMDEVTKGDLSSALLSERDDEIGQLAARFTEMTSSLREAQAETAAENKAKLHLEEQLFRTEKMATLGQLAAEIAHEVGTPLNVISGRATALARKERDRQTVQKHASIIAEQSQRIARIIQRLLDFTRRAVGEPHATRVDVGAVVVETIEFLENKFEAADIVVETRADAGKFYVTGEPDKLQQVLLNLVLNGIQAMSKGGTLDVDIRVATQRRPGLASDPAQPYVCIRIVDTGPGIPDEALERIFEPFYSSRSQDGGTGLGLAVCYGIVKEHDGWLTVSSDDSGSCFEVYLPAADQTKQQKDDDTSN